MGIILNCTQAPGISQIHIQIQVWGFGTRRDLRSAKTHNSNNGLGRGVHQATSALRTITVLSHQLFLPLHGDGGGGICLVVVRGGPERGITACKPVFKP
jgi:hypothetical protein